MAQWESIKLFARRRALIGFVFISPWLIGFLVFDLAPTLASLVLSFSRYDIIRPPRLIGFENYSHIFGDPVFYKVLSKTTYYVIGNVVVGTLAALGIAMLLNQKLRGMSWFRAIYYLPSVTSGVAVAMLWTWVFQPRYGVLNTMLGWIGISGPAWLRDPAWAMPALILVTVWTGIGKTMVIYLAALQGVPTHLYEAANLDGANAWSRFRHVTLPMITPVLFFTLIMGVIGAFQGAFTYAYILTGGGPLQATYVYSLYLYDTAFEYFRMGYASALSWILFAIIFVFTLIQVKTSNSWVYYEGR